MKLWAVLAVGALAAFAALVAVVTIGDDDPAAPKAAPVARAQEAPPEGDISKESREELRKWLREDK